MARFEYKDVTNARSSKSEEILESMSLEKASKIGLMAKELADTYPVQRQTYSKNLDIISPAMISGNASLMIIGDSINNITQANYMRVGYQNKWTPHYWRGISQAISNGNSSQNGAQISGGNGAGISGTSAMSNGSDPENPAVLNTVFSGTQVQPLANLTGINTTLSEQTAAGTTSRAYVLNGILGSLEKWSGSQQSTHIFNGTQTAIRALIYAEQDCTVIGDWKFGSGGNGSDNGNQYNLTAGYNTIEKVVDNTGVTSNNGGSSIYLLGPTGTRIQLLACTYMDKAVTGMQMAYTGGGGFGTANHRYNYGHPSTRLSNPTYNNRPFYYSDEAMKQYLDFMDTNIVMLHIGNNDGISEVVDNVDEIVKRYRKLKSGLKFLLVAPYPSSVDDTRWQAQADFYENLAGSGGNEDVAFLNLTKKVKDDLGNYADWKGTYLVDESTDVHPNLTGANKFAELEWEIITASASAAGTPGTVFPSIVYGNEQYQQLMTSLKRVK
tara:strand:+ start:1518 stop:3005 length:1488 start_codon:yes stop_codon:yes gene_type:complete